MQLSLNRIYELVDNPSLITDLESAHLVDVCEVCFNFWCFNKFKPKGAWDEHPELKNVEHELIDGYELWMVVRCDFVGYYNFIYYPKNPKKGDLINIIFKGAYLQTDIKWIHGEEGLFWDFIYNYVYIDKYIEMKHSHNYLK